MENDSLNNGHIIEVTPDMFKKAANDFSEGNEALKELLTFCFENGIKTTSCCSGHNGEKRPYVQFEFNDNNMKSILKMLKQLSLDDAISNFSFTKQPNVTSNFCVSMQDDKYNEGFRQILEALKYEKEIEISDLNKTRQLIVKSMQNHSVSNSYLEIQEENSSIAIGVGDEYLSVFSPQQEIIPWVDGTRMVEYSKNSGEANSTLNKLESKTKNIKYLAEHPYDSKKINDFWKNNDSIETLEMNPAATIERQHEYGERNVVVVDVLAGSRIESLAKEIMQLHQYGQACTTNFNSFVIDSRDYANPDEIVKAYLQEVEKHRIETTTQIEQKGITPVDVEDAARGVHIEVFRHAGTIINAKAEEKEIITEAKDIND